MRVRLRHRKLAQILGRSALSQNRWAQKMGISSGHLSLLVNGKRLYPTAKTRRRLLEALNVPFEELFELEAASHTGPVPTPRSAGGFRQECAMLKNDFSYGLKQLTREKAFSAAVVLILALGIGVNTALFSVINGVVLTPPPYQDPDRLVGFWVQGGWSKAELAFLQEHLEAFDPLVGFKYSSLAYKGDGPARMLSAVAVSPELFDALGRRPLYGDSFSGQESAGTEQVLLSASFWKSRFGSDPGVVGETIRLDDASYRIAGVMPEDFYFPSPDTEVWVPLDMDPAAADRNYTQLQLLGRLGEGAHLARAQSEVDGVAGLFRERFRYPPEFDKFGGGTLIGAPVLSTYREQVTREVWPVLSLLWGAVALVLLIACVNVANLFLSRVTKRQAEMAVRSALGASRTRLIRQLLIESVLIALAGCAGGILLAYATLGTLTGYLLVDVPQVGGVSLNLTVLLFALALGLLTGLLFGTVPAFQASGVDPRGILSELGRSASPSFRQKRWGRTLVVAEVGLGVVLLAASGMALKSFYQLNQLELGFEPENIYTFSLAPRAEGNRQRAEFFNRVTERLASRGEFEAVGAVQSLPLKSQGWSSMVEAEGGAIEGQASVFWRTVTGHYFQAMGIELVRGRLLGEEDRSGALTCVVSQSFARRYWPGEDPLGRRVTMPLFASALPDDSLTVVGVVEDVTVREVSNLHEETLYTLHERIPFPTVMSFVVRSPLPAGPVFQVARSEVEAVDPAVPVYGEAQMSDIVNRSIANPRALTILLTLFAGLALALAAAGIYSVLSYRVVQNRRALGIRMALGARKADLGRMILWEGLALTTAGLLLGLAGTLAVTGWLESRLYQVSGLEPAVLAAVVLVILISSLAAVWVPARRAASIDPMQAMRLEQ